MNGSIFDTLRLLDVLRGASHTETLAAADIGAGTNTRRRISLRPATLINAGDDAIIVTRIAAQGIKATDVQIVARDLNRHDLALPLPPSLVIDDLPLVGNANEGVEFVIANSAAREVPITFHVAVTSLDWLRRFLGAGIDTEAARAAALRGGA